MLQDCLGEADSTMGPRWGRIDGMGKKGKIYTTASGVGLTVLGVTVPLALPDQVPDWIIYSLIGFGIALALLPWILGSVGRDDDGDGVTQSSQGPQSPNIGTVHGDVHFGSRPSPPPALMQPKKTDHWTRQPTPVELEIQRIREADALAQARRSADFHEKLNLYSQMGRPKPPRQLPPEPEADMPLAAVLVRIYSIRRAVGPVPTREKERREFDRRINLEIADKVKLKKMHTWGRSGDRALERLDDDDWGRGTFDHRKGVLSMPAAYAPDWTYSDLHFDKGEVDRVWPAPLETTNDGKP